MEPTVIPPLEDLHVRLVSQCNLNCRHCYASDWFTRRDQLDVALVERAIDEAMALGLQKVTFTGGEPTLHRAVCDLLAYCVARRLRVKLETNGLLLRQHDGRLMRLLVDHKDLAYLYVSYDLAAQRGITEAEHDAIRDVVLELHAHGVDVRLQTTLTEVNVEHLEELIGLARTHGVRQRIFLGHSTSGNGAALTPFDFDRVLSLFRYLRSLGLPLDLELPPLISGQVQQGCGWGAYRCEIMPNGDVTTCGPITFTHTGFVAGSLRDRSLREIWCDSPYFLEMRRISQRDFDGVCGRCTYWDACRGSCRSVSWTRGEHWFSSYPLCEMYAERHPEEVESLLRPVEEPNHRIESGARVWITGLGPRVPFQGDDPWPRKSLGKPPRKPPGRLLPLVPEAPSR
jgi:radical SAM protein with 4Fe4S-binding SPASM domain